MRYINAMHEKKKKQPQPCMQLPLVDQGTLAFRVYKNKIKLDKKPNWRT